MGDDLIVGGILPIDNATPGDADFDPNAIESDDLLDDFVDDDLLKDGLALTEEEDDDPLFPSEGA